MPVVVTMIMSITVTAGINFAIPSGSSAMGVKDGNVKEWCASAMLDWAVVSLVDLENFFQCHQGCSFDSPEIKTQKYGNNNSQKTQHRTDTFQFLPAVGSCNVCKTSLCAHRNSSLFL